MSDERKYTQEEVETILRRAAERSRGGTESLSHAELIDVARQVGIAPDAVESEMQGIDERREDDRFIAKYEQRRRRGFQAHLTAFLIVQSAIAAINVLTTSYPWALFPLIAWGIGLAFHAVAAFRRLDPEERERKTRKLRNREEYVSQREQKRRDRIERKSSQIARKQATSEAADQFGRAVEKGVATLLSAAAQKIEEATLASIEKKSKAEPDTAFSRYVSDKKGTRPQDPGPKVRISVPEEHSHDDDEVEREDEPASKRGRRVID